MKRRLRCVGGPQDGKWDEHSEAPERRFLRPLKVSYAQDFNDLEIVEVLYDCYTVRRFRADGDTKEILGWDQMKDMDCFLHMLRNWGPTK